MNIKNNKLLMFGLIFLLLISISVASTFISDTGISQWFSDFNMNNKAIANVSTINGINYTLFYNNYSTTRTQLSTINTTANTANTTANSALSLATTANATVTTNSATISTLQTDNATLRNKAKSSIYRELKLPANGLVSYYSFDNDATDQIGTNDGTVTGATQTTSGIVGSAYGFDGLSNVIKLSNLPINNTDTTVCLWYNPYFINSTPSNLYNSFTSGFQISISSSRVAFSIRNGSSSYVVIQDTSASIRTLNTNHFVCGVLYLNGTFKLYSENNAGTTSSYSGSFFGAGNSTGIGNSYTVTSSSFNGTIDEVLIFNRSLSAREVQNLYLAYNPSNLTIS